MELKEVKLEIGGKRPEGNYYLDLLEQVLISKAKKAEGCSLLIYPRESKGKATDQNYSGISKINSKKKITSMLTSHWANMHELKPSEASMEVVNYLSETPYLLNDKAQLYYYSTGNKEYIIYEKYKTAQIDYAQLWKLRKQLASATVIDSDKDLGEYQRIISKYYEQQLYEKAVKDGKKGGKKQGKKQQS